ncbi:pyridoxal-phosphate dependent enzyme [Bdellovibrio sp. NC01]|uniref:pyridoxal-phosphate dependent enzyme n=1 Tax=Bdellovibrio sp. NC01 TaxID=2220073 RepID=UPI00115ACBBE|nr:pyridoxal-phosphate dependent enzyme [Bdellovibrio sp. NC01]QDK36372.1 hypothetical protein DOE51_01530 [Bdellovibrio sp. NC01]
MNLRPRIVEIIDPILQLKAGNRIFTSLEGENPGGSMKDHMVRGEIEELLNTGRLQKGGGVAEVSAGSTAVSLAHYCQRNDLQCVLFVPNGISPEIVANLRRQGATVYQEELAQIYQVFDVFMKSHPELIAFNQLYDVSKRRHYNSFGSLIQNEIGPLAAVIGGVGTGHSLLGISEGCGAGVQAISAEPASFKVSGVRNVAIDRYGDQDSLNAQSFDQRFLITPEELTATESILTSVGEIQIGASFSLVLAAARAYFKGKTHQKIFAISASGKLLAAGRSQKAA